MEKLIEKLQRILDSGHTAGVDYTEYDENTARKIGKVFKDKGYYVYITYRLGRFATLTIQETLPQNPYIGTFCERVEL